MKKYFPKFIAVMFGASVILLLWRMFAPAKSETKLVKKEISKGKITRNVIKGIEHIQVLKKKYNRVKEIDREKNKNIYKMQDSTGDYNLDMILKPQEDKGLIKLDYKLEVKARELTRIDTVSLFRVDTLKIEKVKELPNPFYDTFWFGSAVTTLVIFLFALLIK